MKITGYNIERLVGKGGMAMVYEAIQESLGRRVALKILNPLFADTPEFSRRFINEGRIVASLEHANIITIHDVGISGELHYISMEYLDGGDLKQRIRAGIPVATALEYVETMAGCLQTAHEHGIVHRDVKPANILFRNDESPVLTDFGIAKQLHGDGDRTLTGSTLGSPHYLSPEQAQGMPVDGRADLYSLGIVLYEMLTGRKPFKGSSEIHTINKHLQEPVPRLPEGLGALQWLLDRMLAKSPSDRFPNMDALIKNLGEVREAVGTLTVVREDTRENTVTTPLDEPPPVEEPVNQDAATMVNEEVKAAPPAPPPRRRRALALAASLVVATAAGAYYHGYSPERLAALVSGSAAPAPSVAQVSPATAPEAPAAAPAAAAKPAPPVWRPAPRVDPAKVARVKRQKRIRGLLKSARLALAEKRLTVPEGNNATHYYRKVLEIDPRNREAREGFRRIGTAYGELAESAMEEQRLERAKQYLETGLEVNPGNQTLLALRARAEVMGRENWVEEPIETGTTDEQIVGEHPSELFARIRRFFR